MGVGVPGGGQHPDLHPADLHGVAVADRGALEGDGVIAIDQVGRAGRPGQREAAGDIVIVYVRLGDVGDAHASAGGQRGHPVGVPLRVDDQGGLTVVHEIAAVAELWRLDLEHFHGRLSSPWRVAPRSQMYDHSYWRTRRGQEGSWPERA